jgi:hypothetical protein
MYIYENQSRGFDGLSSVGQTPILRTIQLQFTLNKKRSIAEAELGSYKFQLLDDKSNVVAEQDWTRIPPDMPTRTAPHYYNSYSKMMAFDSSASRHLLKVWVFPVHYITAGKAKMDEASFTKDVSVNLPRGDKEPIKIVVLLAAKTQGFYVPEGQKLQDVLVQNRINPYHVAKSVKRRPDGTYYDVTYVSLEGIVQALEKGTMISPPVSKVRGKWRYQ